MSKKVGGPRQERQNLEKQEAAEHGYARDGLASSAPERSQASSPAEFATTVQVTETERAWIREHLAWFVEHHLITDVTHRVKAGKEATVYLCSAHPSTGKSLLAAKLYREWSLRSSQNMALYQQGRAILNEDGNADQGRSRRPSRGGAKKSKQGAAQTSWLMHEFTLLETLHALGADVPRPLEHREHVLLMEYIGDEAAAAPTLNDVQLEPAEAKRLFDRVIFNVELLLGQGWVHGDLSEYNILYDQGRVVLIDFPQVASCHENPKARSLFERDIERVSRYFERWGHPSNARQLAQELWTKHVSEPHPGNTADDDA